MSSKTVNSNPLNSADVMKTKRTDVEWIGTLYGSAVGAGILFLPLQAISSGIFSLIFATIFIFPMVYLSHKALTRIVLISEKDDEDLTGGFYRFLGKTGGSIATFVYFLCTFSIMTGYAVALPKVVTSCFNIYHISQTDFTATPTSKIILGFIIMFVLVGAMVIGRNFVVKATSLVVIPLIIALGVISLMLIPHWNLSNVLVGSFSWGGFIKSVLMVFPILFFAMNHSPTVSEMAMDYKGKIKDKALLEKKANKVLLQSSTVIFIFTLGFVYSCMLAVNHTGAIAGMQHNENILTIVSDQFKVGILHYLGPGIAITAIVSSFLATFFGTREALNGLISKAFPNLTLKVVDSITIVALFLILWYISVVNLKILGILGAISAPLIAMLLLVLPTIVIYKNKEFEKYRNTLMTVFMLISACVIILGYVIGSLM